MTSTLLPQQPPQAAGEASGEESQSQLLARASEALKVRRLGEVAELEIAIEWSIVHGHPRDDRDPMVTPAGDGAPSLREHAIPELAMARETHPATTRALIADALDLAHRLPLTWAVVRAGECEPWVARKVAGLSRALLADQVRRVDKAVARAIVGHAPSTVLEIARAKVIEADPQTHRAERERSRHERYVRLSRTDAYGYRHIIARVTAGDAVWIDAMIDRVADILSLTHGHDHNHDELRSLALGWLARPVELLQLLIDHTERDTEADVGAATGATVEPTAAPAWASDDLAETLGRFCDLPTQRLRALRGRGRLFVHLTDTAVHTRTGVARIEGVGPIDVNQLHEIFGDADVTVTPVLDLRERRRVDAYEHPEDLKDHVWTQTGGDCFPYTPRTATRDGVDFDHATPYDDTGPPGQTGPHNSGPLRRSHHRTKTFGGYTTRITGPGRHLWRTPNGLAYLVDHTGTTRLTNHQAEVMSAAAEDGVEIYFTTVQLDYQPSG